jgi:hypothetical protein
MARITLAYKPSGWIYLYTYALDFLMKKDIILLEEKLGAMEVSSMFFV